MPVVHQDIAVLVVIFIQSLSPAAVSADLMSDRVSAAFRTLLHWVLGLLTACNSGTTQRLPLSVSD